MREDYLFFQLRWVSTNDKFDIIVFVNIHRNKRAHELFSLKTQWSNYNRLLFTAYASCNTKSEPNSISSSRNHSKRWVSKIKQSLSSTEGLGFLQY